MNDGSLAVAGRSRPSRRARRLGSPAADAFRRLGQNRLALAGGAVVALLAVLAALAPLVAPYDPIRIDARQALEPPSLRHPFGSDHLGRDVLSRVLYGGRLSLRVGLVSVGIALGCGLVLGVPAGFYGGWRDMLVMRAMDALLACPAILLALAILTTVGPGLSNVMIAVGVSQVPQYGRIVRASTRSARAALYVDAARALGGVDARLMCVHVLPNALAPVLAVATLGVATAILVAAGLSFLGLGVEPPTPEWGAMVGSGREYLRHHWWISTFPGLAILLAVLSINLLGDGLREALDPVLRKR